MHICMTMLEPYLYIVVLGPTLALIQKPPFCFLHYRACLLEESRGLDLCIYMVAYGGI